MFKVIGLQACAALLAVLIAGIFGGQTAALSAFAAAAACWIPNALFAIKLTLPPGHTSSPLSFLVGEVLKLVFMVGLLIAAYTLLPQVSSLGLLLGVVVTMHANLFAFLLKS